MDFNSVYGHDLIKNRLFKGVIENKLFNSYVLEGDKGSGKKTLALEFCAFIMCKNKENMVPCGECDACRKVFSFNHPDIIYVEKENGKKTIGVDVIRDSVINNIYVKPLVADRKIIVIPEAESLTEQSQNALLKVLEEPPDYVSFILTVQKASMLLQTVLSRSVVFSLMPVSEDVVLKILKEKTNGKFLDTELSFATSFAGGVPGKGLEILENEDFSRLYAETGKHLFSLFGKKSAVSAIEKYLTDEKDNIDIIIDFILILLRDALLVKLGQENLVISKNNIFELRKNSAKVTEKNLVKSSEIVLDYKEKLRRNAGFLSASLDMLLKLSDELSV